jgi:hypothetical protein
MELNPKFENIIDHLLENKYAISDDFFRNQKLQPCENV